MKFTLTTLRFLRYLGIYLAAIVPPLVVYHLLHGPHSGLVHDVAMVVITTAGLGVTQQAERKLRQRRNKRQALKGMNHG
jgi:uncharacterized membrane protein YdjX (TVP38/TMEM64 family)